MAESDTNRSSLYFSEETTWNETPSTPTMLELQRVSDTLQHQKNIVVPATIRTDRLQEDLINVGAQAMGGLAFELRHTQYDSLISAMIGAPAAFSTLTITASTDISASTTDDSFNRTTGSFITDGAVAGMWILVSGFASSGNNGIFKILTVATLKIVVDANLTTEAATPAITIHGKMARNGVTKRSFLIERRFNDISQYQQMRGMRPNTMALEIRANQIITGNMDFMGARGTGAGASVAGASTAAASNPAFDASNNVLSIVEGGVALTTPLQSIMLNINGNAGVQPAVANQYPIGVRYGTLELTGTLVAYFEDLTLFNKFVNHTPTSIVLKVKDANNKYLIFSLFRVFLGEGQNPVQGQNQDVFLTLPFRASYDSVSGFGVQFDTLV